MKPLPTTVEKVLQPTDDNVMVWSQFFYKNPSPTKLKGMKTVPSPATQKIGGLLHAVASYAGLTAEAVWYVDIYSIIAGYELISNFNFYFSSSKLKKENFKKMEHLLKVTENVITDMEKKQYVSNNVSKF